MTDPRLCFDVWIVKNISTNDFGQVHWDMNDSVNYTRHHKKQ